MIIYGAFQNSINNEMPIDDPVRQHHDLTGLIDILTDMNQDNQILYPIEDINDMLLERERNLLGCLNTIFNIKRLIDDNTRLLDYEEYIGILDKFFQIIKYLPGLDDNTRQNIKIQIEDQIENEEAQVVPQQANRMVLN